MAGRRIVVFSSLLQIEAHMAHQLLLGIGLDAQVRGHLRGGLGGLIPFNDAHIEVWVPEADLREAQRALELQGSSVADGKLSIVELSPEQGALSNPGGPPRGASSELAICPACGEDWEPGWEVCWSCQHTLPE